MSGGSHFSRLLSRFESVRILVLGDIVADEYVVGRPAKISREAPVLILHFAESFVRPGGATNTAHNAAALGAQVCVVGVVGDDEPGRELQAALHRAGISTEGLIVDRHRPTSTKTRIVARGTQEAQQQVVRIDRVEDSSVAGPSLDRMIDALRRALAQVDCLLVSDYENGVISPDIIESCLPRARELGIPVIVDSHGDLLRFRGVTAATPNQPEVELTLGRRLDRDEELNRAGEQLRRDMDARGVLVTRGSMGLVLYEDGREPYYLPTALGPDIAVVDPAGAGDTVSAVFALAVTCGASMREAAFLSDVGGGETVRKLGTATVSRAELLEAVERTALPLPSAGTGL